MKIAVTYENGNVFQHFGHTENFKIYEVEDNEIKSAEVISTEGSGHEALAGFLADRDVNVLICGGCGSGAADALADAGIEVYSGAEGDTDVAVATYLRGALTSAGVNCDHHDHEHDHEHGEDGCGSSCGGCGGGCGGCGGGCGSMPTIEGKNVGKAIKVHYTGTLEDGSKFDSSYDRNEPLEFICGVGMMIPGFDQACAEMEEGEIRDVKLQPEDAYGMPNPNAVFTIQIAMLPGSEELSVGDRVMLTNQMGQPVPAAVVDKDDTNITFDTNHELAGKVLNFRIEMVEIMK